MDAIRAGRSMIWRVDHPGKCVNAKKNDEWTLNASTHRKEWNKSPLPITVRAKNTQITHVKHVILGAIGWFQWLQRKQANWGNGLLEVSMMREFHRTAQLDGMLNGILEETSGENLPIELRWEHELIQLLFSTGDREALGTIQDAAAHDSHTQILSTIPVDRSTFYLRMAALVKREVQPCYLRVEDLNLSHRRIQHNMQSTMP
ncbi:hypothetical protein B0H14DRAFT_2563900 [Mycena olivaceomarginata]|nr:hypothetical protein B0H14DRAFT_2563900 [Mycena olivaceomarginata]